MQEDTNPPSQPPLRSLAVLSYPSSVMSPSMPITIAYPASATSSAASSPSSSSSGVYVPVHRRTPSDRAAPEPKRTRESPSPHHLIATSSHTPAVPIYTPAELMQLAQSPLAKQVSAAMHGALHGQEFSAAIALSKRQQRAREYKTNAGALRDNNNVVVVVPRRRPVGRVAERSNSRRGGASKFMDAASWRGQMTRQPVTLAV
ncbi:hypothetical protein DFH09DRAFT_142479 [Mycena vulgaris]|nr:hypothetical protein DFH09DRAFT_142479 [Mycena vulgaris]